MTIKIYTQATHCKFSFEDALPEEKTKALKILTTKFKALDSNAKYNPAVKWGGSDGYENFYYEENGIMPIGLLPYVYEFFDREKIKFELVELRTFPSVDKKFVKKLIDGEISFTNKEDPELVYTPRPYQTKALLTLLKERGGIAQLPTGCISWDSIINTNRHTLGRKKTIEKMFKSFNHLNKGKQCDSAPTFTRSYNGKTIQLNEVESVSYSGIKELYELTLANGKTLKATADHRIMTDNGWVEMQSLKPGLLVMCDTLRPIPGNRTKSKHTDAMVWNLWCHPFGNKSKTKKEKRGYTLRLEKHRIIFEANLNGLSFDEFVSIVRTDLERSKTLKFMNPKTHCIHHKDFNHYNNDIENLQMLTYEEHSAIHSDFQKFNFNQGQPIYSEVVSVEYWGTDHTYDIGCFENHNFVANGIVVHNSGKSMLSAMLCRAYHPHKVLMIFDSVTLVHQTYYNFTVKYGFEEDEVGVIQGKNFKYNPLKNSVILLSMQSYEKCFHIFPQIKIIQSDESHITGRSPVAQKVIYSCQNAPVHIGLTATARYFDNPVEQLRLYATMGPIVFQEELTDHMDEGFLSNTVVEILTIDMPDDEMPVVTGSYSDSYDRYEIKWEDIEDAIIHLDPEMKENKKEMKLLRKKYDEEDFDSIIERAIEYVRDFWIKEGRFYEKYEGKLCMSILAERGDESTHYVMNDRRNKIIAEAALKHERVLLFFRRIEHGEALKLLLPNAYLIHGKSETGYVREAEAALKRDASTIVISSEIWAKGKDIPEINTVMNAGGGVSQMGQIQKMGRGTRLAEWIEKNGAKMIDTFDTFSPLSRKQSRKRLSTYEDLGLQVTIIEGVKE